MVSLALETKFGALKFNITLEATKYMLSIAFMVARLGSAWSRHRDHGAGRWQVGAGGRARPEDNDSSRAVLYVKFTAGRTARHVGPSGHDTLDGEYRGCVGRGETAVHLRTELRDGEDRRRIDFENGQGAVRCIDPVGYRDKKIGKDRSEE